uniref:MHD2 domain-containing protein n=1 Tax=Tetraselmis sp. GSL018 TaxID=582737 RepID=A0A061R7U1_9CHLO
MEWAGNTLRLDKESEMPAMVNFLNSSLLELLQSIQEVLERIGRRAMRATVKGRRYRIGEMMSRLFETSIQRYAGALSQEFVEQLESGVKSRLAQVLKQAAGDPPAGKAPKSQGSSYWDAVGATAQADRPADGPILTPVMAAKINSLWLILSNHHRVEQNIHESATKGRVFEAMQLDVSNYNLENAQATIEGMKQAMTRASHGDGSSDEGDDDISEVSAALEEADVDGAGDGGAAGCARRMVEQVEVAQHAISNMLLAVGIGVGNALASIASAGVEGMLARAGREPSWDVGSSAAPQDVSDLIAQELAVLSETLNGEAFRFVLEASWCLVLKALEAGVLHTTSTWMLASDRDRQAVAIMLDTLEETWRGGGGGLPSQLTQRTAARLRELLRLHACGTPELAERLRQMTTGGGPAQDLLRADPLEILEPGGGSGGAATLAHQNVAGGLGYIRSSSLREVGALDLARVLRQRAGDAAAEKAVRELARCAEANVQAMVGLGDAAETTLLASETTLKELGLRGKLFVLTSHVVFTDLFHMPSDLQALQAVKGTIDTTIKTAWIVPKLVTSTVTGAASTVTGTLQPVTSTISNTFRPVTATVSSTFQPVASAVSGTVKGTVGPVVSTVQGTLELVSQSVWKGGPSRGDVTEVLSCELITDVQLRSPPGKDLEVELKLIDSSSRTFLFPSKSSANELLFQLKKVVHNIVPPGQKLLDKGIVPQEVQEALEGREILSWTQCGLKHLFGASSGDLFLTVEALAFVTKKEKRVLKFDNISQIKASRGWVVDFGDGTSVQLQTKDGQTLQFVGFSEIKADEISSFIRSKLSVGG